MEFLYLSFTGLIAFLTMHYAFDESPDFTKVFICSIITIILFILGMAMFPQLFSEF